MALLYLVWLTLYSTLFNLNTPLKTSIINVWQLPSPIAVILTLDQDQKTGHLTLKKYFNVDMSKVHGLWITCGASLSPWNTHLSSEEYEPDAFDKSVQILQCSKHIVKTIW
jgi:secreted PhoX family phosphatase